MKQEYKHQNRKDMEHSQVITTFSTKEHLCADYHIFLEENGPQLEIEYAMRDGWNDSYDEDERVGNAPFIFYSKRRDDFFYGYNIHIDDDCADTIADEEEFTPEEKEYLERVIRENFDNL